MATKIDTIYETNNYDFFKPIEGNRPVDEKRVKRVMESIKSIGQLKIPVLINDKREIIDGQARGAACKRLNIPVYYVVQAGADIRDVRAANQNSTNWTVDNYISSYAETGNVSYRYLQILIERFRKTFGSSRVILYACKGAIMDTNKLKFGKLEISPEQYMHAEYLLTKLSEYVGIFKRIDGRREYYYYVLLFCMDDPEVDNNRLHEKVYMLQASLIPVSNMMQALEQIERVYNNKVRSKVFIKTNYIKAMDGRLGWYKAKYGEKEQEA